MAIWKHHMRMEDIDNWTRSCCNVHVHNIDHLRLARTKITSPERYIQTSDFFHQVCLEWGDFHGWWFIHVYPIVGSLAVLWTNRNSYYSYWLPSNDLGVPVNSLRTWEWTIDIRSTYRKTGPPRYKLTLVYKPWNHPHFYTSSLYLPYMFSHLEIYGNGSRYLVGPIL